MPKILEHISQNRGARNLTTESEGDMNNFPKHSLNGWTGGEVFWGGKLHYTGGTGATGVEILS